MERRCDESEGAFILEFSVAASIVGYSVCVQNESGTAGC